jgi:light-regulated signal transduction histidine kinase (bacteriophytochrome)
VIGYLELAREDETLDEATAGFLDVARRNADQLPLIVQHLLADQVARSGTEKLRLRQRRIVVAHGAQIGVRSTPGEGSTFTLRFPLEAPEAG